LELTSTHWPAQDRSPFEHMQLPEEHVVPVGHVVPHPPQFRASVRVSTQTPLQDWPGAQVGSWESISTGSPLQSAAQLVVLPQGLSMRVPSEQLQIPETCRGSSGQAGEIGEGRHHQLGYAQLPVQTSPSQLSARKPAAQPQVWFAPQTLLAGQ
jgi:hypothetical protein